MEKSADISETQMLLTFGEKVCMNLLKDHTTQQNIYWATDSYAETLGDGYTFFDPITLDKITGEGRDQIIRPHALKPKEERAQRVKDKAEVFTPTWVCNAQNNLVDEAWFGRKDIFNRPDPEDQTKWINIEEKIVFPDTEGRTWKDYVASTRLEITCGEAPYLCSRYDVVTGTYNEDVRHRIGILDRKLRIVSENTDTTTDWILWAKIALRATYGFEWQGDSLLLAREALFYTFMEHFIDKFDEKRFNRIKTKTMPGVAYIISWNIWQMDGLKFGLPGYTPYVKPKPKIIDSTPSLFGEADFPPLVLEPEHVVQPHEKFCEIKDFLQGVNLMKKSLSYKDFSDSDKKRKQKFVDLVKE